MKKILLTATVQSHICQFHRPLVEMLHDNGYEVHVAASDNLNSKNGLKLDFVDKVFDIPFSRSPLRFNNMRALRLLKKIIRDEHYDIIHCNTPVGGIITRLAAQKARKSGTKVYYTAHGFHFYKGAPIKNWLLYYPIEKYFARHTDKLITISGEDYKMAVHKKFKTKIYRIHSVGVNSSKYYIRSETEIIRLRNEKSFSQNDFICLCTGELNKNKNQISVINAVPEVVDKIHNFKLLLAGNGTEYDCLQARINALGMNDYIKLIGYRTDLQDYVAACDVAVSASIREGLGINLIEAACCGKPVVGSDNRGHREFINDGENGLLVQEGSSIGLAEKISQLYTDKVYYKRMSANASESANMYLDSNVKKELYDIYFK